jgi:hypothetical protein
MSDQIITVKLTTDEFLSVYAKLKQNENGDEYSDEYSDEVLAFENALKDRLDCNDIPTMISDEDYDDDDSEVDDEDDDELEISSDALSDVFPVLLLDDCNRPTSSLCFESSTFTFIVTKKGREVETVEDVKNISLCDNNLTLQTYNGGIADFDLSNISARRLAKILDDDKLYTIVDADF